MIPSQLLPTAMCDAYLRALVRKVRASTPTTTVMLPIGLVTVSELTQVLHGLGLIQKEADAR
jgi:hypothetical protein